MVERHEWDGVLKRSGGRRHAHIRLVMPLARSTHGAARAFRGMCSDKQEYWIKVPGGLVGPRKLAAEQIVGRLGTLLRAATCPVEAVVVPAGLDWEYRPGEMLQACVAHGSLQIPGVVETRELNRPRDDDNGVRYTSFAALYDWAWGDDIQGLEVLSDDGRFYSHDHGWFLPPGRGDWTSKTVEEFVDVPHELSGLGFDLTEASRLAARLQNVARGELISVLAHIPEAWGITDRELESIGYYLERRAPQVAARLLRGSGGGP